MNDFLPGLGLCEFPLSPESLFRLFDSLDLEFRAYEHAPVYTVEEANRLDLSIPGCHTRNLFLRDKKGAQFLVTLRHDTPIDLKKLSDLLGAHRFSFGSAERLLATLGVRPGAVTPLAIVNDRSKSVTLVLEQAMMDEALVNFHPLVNTGTVSLKPSDFLIFLERIGVVPRVCDLGPAAPD